LPRAHAVAARISGNTGEADDIAQEAFTRVWLHADTWRGDKARFSSWFYRIVANVAIDRARQRKATSDIEWESIADEAPTADVVVADRQAASRIQSAVMALSERQRVALTLCYFEGFSNQQAAEILGLHIKALEGLLVRARRTLKEQLKDLLE
jgi:RNA polymerase sigma-70 factor (ECF subfamily)